MSMTREQAIAELRRRGFTDDDLRAKGIDVPRSAPKDNRSLLDRIEDPIIAAGSGVAQGLTDIPGGLYRFATGRPIPQLGRLAPGAAEAQDRYPLTTKIGEAAGFIGGLAPAGVPATVSRMVPSALGAIGRGVGAVGDISAQGGLLGALYGPATLQDGAEAIGEQATRGAVLSAILGGALGAYPAARTMLGRSLRRQASQPGSVLRSPEQVGRMTQSMGEQPIDIGSLIDSPGLSVLAQEYLPLAPYTGTRAATGRVIAAGDEGAANFVQGLRGELAENEVPEAILGHMGRSYDAQRALANELYAPLDNAATEAGFSLIPSNTVKMATAALEKNAKAVQANAKSQLPAQTVNDLNRLSALSTEDATDINLIRDEISAYKTDARQLRQSGDRQQAALYEKMHQSLEKDLNESMKALGDDELFTNYQNANKHYRENVVPYFERPIQKLLNGEESADDIHRILTSKRHQKVLEHLPQEARHLIGYRFLQTLEKDAGGGEAMVSPSRLINAVDRIKSKSPRVYNSIFTKPQQAEIERINNLYQVSKEGRVAARKPPTGFRGNPLMKLIGIGGTFGLGEYLDNDVLKALGIAGLGAPFAARALRSPRLQQAFITGEGSLSPFERGLLSSAAPAVAQPEG